LFAVSLNDVVLAVTPAIETVFIVPLRFAIDLVIFAKSEDVLLVFRLYMNTPLPFVLLLSLKFASPRAIRVPFSLLVSLMIAQLLG